MVEIRESSFEFPPHLRKWCPSVIPSHFEFHRLRCQVAPQGLKLAEIQAQILCEGCPPGGGPARRGSGPRCQCAVCVDHEEEN